MTMESSSIPMRRRQQFDVGPCWAPVPTQQKLFLFNMALVVVLIAPQIVVLDAFVPSHVVPSFECNRVKLGQSTQQPMIFRTGQILPSLRASKAASDNDDVYTVQILMSDTGGGHRASANALRDAFDVLHPGMFQCDIVDIYTDYGPFWPYNDYVSMYRLMSKYKWMWNVFYRFGETDFGLWLNEFLLTTFCYEPFKDCMDRPFDSTRRRADMVVSVHPLCQDIPLKILSELDERDNDENAATTNKASKTPFVTVVTDLGGAHKTWFNPGVDKCFVPSDVLNEKARSRGLDPSQIVQYGLPIRKGFWSTTTGNQVTNSQSNTVRRKIPFLGRPKNRVEKKSAISTKTINTVALRERLGLDVNLPTCLVMGGGDGMGGIVDIATALGKRLGDGDNSSNNGSAYQMVVVCGNNKQAKQQLETVGWGPGVEVHVKGFVNNMDEFMNAADCLVTKAGPGTIAEACICGLPCMLFAYLPGQEEGNVPFVEESGFGKYSSNPQVIADTVSSWLESPETMEAMKEAALAAARPSATLDIANDLAEIAFNTRKQVVVGNEKVLVAVR